MICIYPAGCTDFSSNGLGALAPQSAEVSETLNGSYELTLVHPQDDAGKWRRLAEGRIIRTPVPAAMTPILTMETSASPAGEVWRVSTRRDPLRLRSGTGTKYKISTGWITTEANETGLVYISLGYMYSTYQMYLYPEHPMFIYSNGALKAISQISYEAQLAAETAQSRTEALSGEFRRVMRLDQETGLHIGDNQTGNEVLIDSDSVNIVMNGQKYSKFAANYVQFGQYQLRRSADGGLVFKLKGGS